MFSSGWRESHGGTASVDEPATGNSLGRIGIADAEDVARAAATAHAAQRDWAATPFQERAGILRRAGEIIEANAEAIEWWIVREAGSIPPKAQLETHVEIIVRGTATGRPTDTTWRRGRPTGTSQ